MDERHRPAITTFVGHLVHNKAVPSTLWDLNDTNHSPLHGHFNPKLVVNTMKLNNTTLYFIQLAGLPSLQDPTWELVVEDPITAPECYQCDLGPSIIDVAR